MHGWIMELADIIRSHYGPIPNSISDRPTCLLQSQVSPETPVWPHCPSCSQCAV